MTPGTVPPTRPRGARRWHRSSCGRSLTRDAGRRPLAATDSHPVRPGVSRMTELNPILTASQLRQINTICERFEDACSGNTLPPLEKYLVDVPTDLLDALLRELVRSEAEQRR